MPTFNFKLSDGRDLGDVVSWIPKDYLLSVYPQIGNQLITPELWTWGYTNNGDLGTNDNISRSTPVTTFAGGANWKQCSGRYAIKNDGTLWTWGWGLLGNLGNNATTDRSTPVTTFAGGTNWKQVANGYLYAVAVKTDGTLWGWGFNGRNSLGSNDTTNRNSPIPTFAGGTNWKQVDSGYAHVAAVKTDGTLWTWGYSLGTFSEEAGQLGTNATGNRPTPVTTFAGGTNWKQVSCGQYHTAAIKTDGTLWTWGYNNWAQIGDNTTRSRSTPVTTFAGGTNWKQVSCGQYHTAAIKTDGTLWTWGRGSSGRLGTNNGSDRSTPVTTFAGGTNWKQIASGNNNTAATKTDGTLWVWGDGSFGVLGNNVNGTSALTPVTTFAGGTNWKTLGFLRFYSGPGIFTAIKTSDDLQGI
jgi:alpha-tubulin suppressor-like RCC1 family protein